MRSLNAHPAVPWVTTLARLVVAVVLIVAGWLKIGTPALSIQAVQAYELLPAQVATAMGYGLPIVEIVVGVLLVAGLLTRAAGVVSALLMLAFVIGIASAWARGLRIDCGCFGGGGKLAAGQSPSYFWEILRDGGLFLLGVWIIRFAPGRLSLDSALGLVPAGAARDDDEDADESGEDDGGGRVTDDDHRPDMKESL
ncbi:MauE/DoxX family redox-associated membrane protein [Sphaerisporangium rhizosphaerae]|uniref:MauE/DoxX family redox-associated membrane protein n=1 Tax=Sphaerisporangium rhizosphaerae TaxID=2269375 RepID=A0ABW2P5R9_9ACTN